MPTALIRSFHIDGLDELMQDISVKFFHTCVFFGLGNKLIDIFPNAELEGVSEENIQTVLAFLNDVEFIPIEKK